MIEPLRQQSLRLGNRRILPNFGVGEAINPPLARQVPTFDPVADVEPAVRAEVAIGRQNTAEEIVAIDGLERGSFRLDRERMDLADARLTAKVANEEMVLVALGQGGRSIVEAEAGRARCDVRQRRN